MTEQEKKGIVLQFLRTTSSASPTLEGFLEAAGCSAQQLASWIEGKEDIPEKALAGALEALKEDRDLFDTLVKNYDKFTTPGHHILE